MRRLACGCTTESHPLYGTFVSHLSSCIFEWVLKTTSCCKDEMSDIWREQRKHVMCIQDPPDVHLYTITGHLHKGGVRLPILQCSRGSTCLESFYPHLARFIPGTAASAVNFQAYLVDGIARWNTSQANAAIDCL